MRAMYCDPPVNSQTVKVGVVGLGYWVPNLARNFDAIPQSDLAWCCDGRPAARERFQALFPRARFTGRVRRAAVRSRA